MKNRILSLCVGVCILSAMSCHQDCPLDEWEKGRIIGIDYRECACCGGFFIEIGYQDTLRAQELPAVFQQNLEPGDLPVAVRLRWEPDPTPCLGDEIIVREIERL